MKKSYEKTLKDLNLSRIEAKDGTPFDPNLHEAIRVEGDGENEVISQVLRPGYTYEGEVLRPTMVNVKRV